MNQLHFSNSSTFKHSWIRYLRYISGIILGIIIPSELLLRFAAARASKTLHSTSLSRVLSAPMTFFDTQPIGRIMSRFSQDIFTIDLVVPAIGMTFLYSFFDVRRHLIETVDTKGLPSTFLNITSLESLSSLSHSASSSSSQNHKDSEDSSFPVWSTAEHQFS